jgi:hypothetical protein
VALRCEFSSAEDANLLSGGTSRPLGQHSKSVGEPGVVQICCRLAAVITTLTHRPKLGERRRRSTATSEISPNSMRTNFPADT